MHGVGGADFIEKILELDRAAGGRGIQFRDILPLIKDFKKEKIIDEKLLDRLITNADGVINTVLLEAALYGNVSSPEERANLDIFFTRLDAYNRSVKEKKQREKTIEIQEKYAKRISKIFDSLNEECGKISKKSPDDVVNASIINDSAFDDNADKVKKTLPNLTVMTDKLKDFNHTLVEDSAKEASEKMIAELDHLSEMIKHIPGVPSFAKEEYISTIRGFEELLCATGVGEYKMVSFAMDRLKSAKTQVMLNPNTEGIFFTLFKTIYEAITNILFETNNTEIAVRNVFQKLDELHHLSISPDVDVKDLKAKMEEALEALDMSERELSKNIDVLYIGPDEVRKIRKILKDISARIETSLKNPNLFQEMVDPRWYYERDKIMLTTKGLQKGSLPSSSREELMRTITLMLVEQNQEMNAEDVGHIIRTGDVDNPNCDRLRFAANTLLGYFYSQNSPITGTTIALISTRYQLNDIQKKTLEKIFLKPKLSELDTMFEMLDNISKKELINRFQESYISPALKLIGDKYDDFDFSYGYAIDRCMEEKAAMESELTQIGAGIINNPILRMIEAKIEKLETDRKKIPEFCEKEIADFWKKEPLREFKELDKEGKIKRIKDIVRLVERDAGHRKKVVATPLVKDIKNSYNHYQSCSQEVEPCKENNLYEDLFKSTEAYVPRIEQKSF